MQGTDDNRRLAEPESPRLAAFVKASGVARVFDNGSDSGLAEASWKELRELAAAGDRVLLVCMINRPMVQAFMLRLENEVYPPGTPLNLDYRLYLCWWEKSVWACILVPIADLPEVTEFADQFGLRMRKGIPAVVSKRGTSRFPAGEYPTIWTLENVH